MGASLFRIADPVFPSMLYVSLWVGFNPRSGPFACLGSIVDIATQFALASATIFVSPVPMKFL